MALFDPSMFNPQSFQGVSGLMGGLFPYKIPQSAGFAPQEQPAPQQAMDMSARSQTPPAPLTAAPPAPSGPLFAPQAQEPSLSDRLQAFAHNPAGSHGLIPKLLDAFTGLSTGVRTDPQGIAIQQLNATYQALKQSGVPEPLARAGALNPEVLKSIAATNFGPPKTVDYNNPNTGLKGTAVYDTATRAFKDIITGKPVDQAQPTFAGSTSPYAPSAPPPGVDPAAWRKAEAEKIVGDEQKLREQGEGSLQFLPDAIRVLGRVQGKQGTDAIGPWQGSPTMNDWVRPTLGAIPGDPFGSSKALGDFNTLKSDLTRLSTTGLKASFGARPTNVEVQMNKDTYGGMQTADQATAANILKERIQNAYANLSRNIQHGFIRPDAVPQDVLQYGVQNGYLDGKKFGIQQPAQQQAQPAQQHEIPPAEQRKSGQVYNTPKGPARWMGNGWQLVK